MKNISVLVQMMLRFIFYYILQFNDFTSYENVQMRQSAKKVIINNISYIIRELQFFSGLELNERNVIFLILNVYLEQGLITNYDIIDFAISVRKQPELSVTARSILTAIVCGRNDLGQLISGLQPQQMITEQLQQTQIYQNASILTQTFRSNSNQQKQSTQKSLSRQYKQEKCSNLNEILTKQLSDFYTYRQQDSKAVKEISSQNNDLDSKYQYKHKYTNEKGLQQTNYKSINDQKYIESAKFKLSRANNRSSSQIKEYYNDLAIDSNLNRCSQQYAIFLNILFKDKYKFTYFAQMQSRIQSKKERNKRNNLITYLNNFQGTMRYKLGWLLTLQELNKEIQVRKPDMAMYNLSVFLQYLKFAGYAVAGPQLRLLSLKRVQDLISSLKYQIIEDKNVLINILQIAQCSHAIYLDYQIGQNVKLSVIQDDKQVWRLLLSTIPKSMPLIEKILEDSLIGVLHNINDGSVYLTTEPSEEFFQQLLHGQNQSGIIIGDDLESSSQSLVNILSFTTQLPSKPINRDDIYDVLVLSKQKITCFSILKLRNIAYINKQRKFQLKIPYQEVKGLVLVNVGMEKLQQKFQLEELYSQGNVFYPEEVTGMQLLSRFESYHDTFSDSKRCLVHVLLKSGKLQYIKVRNGTNICNNLVIKRNIKILWFFYAQQRQRSNIVLKLEQKQIQSTLLVLQDTHYDEDIRKFISPVVRIDGDEIQIKALRARLCKVPDIASEQ